MDICSELRPGGSKGPFSTSLVGIMILLCMGAGSLSAQPIIDYEEGEALQDDGIWREAPAAPPPLRNLRIASWNLSPEFDFRTKKERNPATPPPKDTDAKPTLETTGGNWRHTFGSQRRNQPKSPDIGTRGLDADVVLLQGVRSVRATRKMFPARHWRLIMSRQILKIADLGYKAQSTRPENFTTTAIAVRYQRTVRVTGQQHLPTLSGDETARKTQGVPQSASDATAARLLVNGRSIWLVAIDLRQHCATDEDDCAAQSALKEWIAQRKTERLAVEGAIVGGPGATQQSMRTGNSIDAAAEDVSDACRNQGIRASGKLNGSVEKAMELAKCVKIFTLSLND